MTIARTLLMTGIAACLFAAPATAQGVERESGFIPTHPPVTVAAPAAPAAEADAAVIPPNKRMREDTDGDGYISRDEFLARHIERFNQYDTDKDGRLSYAERRASFPKSDAKGAGKAAKKDGEDKQPLLKRFFD